MSQHKSRLARDPRPVTQIALELERLVPSNLTDLVIALFESPYDEIGTHFLEPFVEALIANDGEEGVECFINNDMLRAMNISSIDEAVDRVAALRHAWHSYIHISYHYPTEGKLLVRFYAALTE